MRILRLIFAIAVSCGLILAGYYLVWNFMANKRLVTIINSFEKSEKFDISFKSSLITGYPDNININIDNLKVESTDDTTKLDYKIGNVLFKIYPFVLEQQAEVILPTTHSFKTNINGEEKQFKLQTSNIDLRFLENTVNVDLSDVKLFDVDANKLIMQAEKVYYTGFIDNEQHFKFNAKNLKVGKNKVDSILLDIELTNINQLNLFSNILTLLVFNNTNYVESYNNIIKSLYKNKSIINLKNMKLVNNNIWFELVTRFSTDSRSRLQGSVDIVSNDLDTTQDILQTLTANNKLDVSKIELVKRLRAKNENRLLRISGKMERGFLQIFNEKVARVLPILKK